MKGERGTPMGIATSTATSIARVNHRTSDQNIATQKNDFGDVVDLFESRHTSHLVKRQAKALRTLVKLKSGGLVISELPESCRLLQLTFDFTRQADDANKSLFTGAVCDLIRVHGLPFRNQVALAENVQCDLLCLMLKTLARGLALDMEIKIAVAEAFSAFLDASRGYGLDTFDGKCTIPADSYDKSVSYRTVTASGVIPCVVDTLKELLGRPVQAKTSRIQTNSSQQLSNAVRALCRLCRDLSYSINCVDVMFEAGVVDLMDNLLGRSDIHVVAAVAIEMFWNVAELNSDSRTVLGSDGNMRILGRALERALKSSRKMSERESRNELVCLLSLLAQPAENMVHFARSGVLALLLECSTRHEKTTDNGANAPNMPRTSPRSFEVELKKLAWGVISDLVEQHRCLSLIIEKDFLGSVLAYLRTENNSHEDNSEAMSAVAPMVPASMWSSCQLLDLQELALSVLYKVSPVTYNALLRKDASKVLMQFVRACLAENSDYLAEKALSAYVRLLTVVTGSSEKIVLRSNVKDEISSLLDLAQDVNRSRAFQSECLRALVCLCKDNEEAQYAFRKASGLAMLLDFLRCDSQMHEGTRASTPNKALLTNAIGDTGKSMNLSNEWLLPVVACLRSAVVGNHKNEAYFVVADGIDALLDVAKNARPAVLAPILGILADLAKRRKAKQFILEWRCTDSQRTAITLCVQMWTNHCERDHNGPQAMQSDEIGHAVHVSSVNLKSAIFALCSSLGFDGMSPTHGVEKSILHEIQSYPELCELEAWRAVERTLQDDNFRPTSPDAELLAEKLHAGVTKHNDIEHRKRRAQEEAEREEMMSLLHAIKASEQQQINDHRDAVRGGHKTPRHGGKIRSTPRVGGLKGTKQANVQSLKQQLKISKEDREAMVTNSLLRDETFANVLSLGKTEV